MGDVVTEFKALLDRDGLSEQAYQDFLEEHTELIYTPFLLNHWVHLNAVISKFPLDTSIQTDLAYLTKSSDRWHVVLVELEHPGKRLFTVDGRGKISTMQPLTDAIDQVNSWREFVGRNRNEVIRRLAPLRKPLEGNSVKFKYVLVIGRRHQKAINQVMRDRLDSLCTDDFRICTYDTLISAYEHGPARNLKLAKLNVLRLVREHFEFKYLHRHPENMFAYMGPTEIVLTPQQREKLIAHGYEIPEWEKGNLLRINYRKAWNEENLARMGHFDDEWQEWE